MQNLIQYQFKTKSLFFDYLNGKLNEGKLISGLKAIERHAKKNLPKLKDAGIWFKFTPDDTGATTIRDIDNNLSKPTLNNYQYLKDSFARALEAENLQIYYS